MKTFSQYLAKITLLVILATSLYLPASIKIARADDSAVCKFVNAQNGSSGNSKVVFGAPLTQNPGEKPEDFKTRQNKRIQDYMTEVAKADAAKKTTDTTYANKLVVITEEPLGAPSAGFSTTCARVTECSLGLYDANNPNQIRKCFTSYDTIDKCNGITPPDAQTMQQASFYRYCEIVQVYFSDGGTSLLYGYIGAIYRYVAVLGGFIAVLVLIIAGVMRSAAGDNTEMISKANQLVTRCITGLIVLFLSALILYTINPNFFVISI